MDDLDRVGHFKREKINTQIMGLLSKFFSNARKPEGFLGKIMVNGMNGGGHAAMANWALAMVTIGRDDRILDIGCGGGANIARLLQRTLRVQERNEPSWQLRRIEHHRIITSRMEGQEVTGK